MKERVLYNREILSEETNENETVRPARCTMRTDADGAATGK